MLSIAITFFLNDCGIAPSNWKQSVFQICYIVNVCLCTARLYQPCFYLSSSMLFFCYCVLLLWLCSLSFECFFLFTYTLLFIYIKLFFLVYSFKLNYTLLFIYLHWTKFCCLLNMLSHHDPFFNCFRCMKYSVPFYDIWCSEIDVKMDHDETTCRTNNKTKLSLLTITNLKLLNVQVNRHTSLRYQILGNHIICRCKYSEKYSRNIQKIWITLLSAPASPR